MSLKDLRKRERTLRRELRDLINGGKATPQELSRTKDEHERAVKAIIIYLNKHKGKP